MRNILDKKYAIILAVVAILGVGTVVTKYIVMPRLATPPSAGEAPKQVLSDKVTIQTDANEQADFSLKSDVYNQNAITEISNFEKNEAIQWQGSAVIDEKVFYEGVRSLGLVSADHRGAISMLEKQLDLSAMKQIEFMFNVGDVDAFESAMIDFSDVDFKNYYRYTFSNLKNGWSLIQIPKEKFIYNGAADSGFDWSKVEKIRLYTLSRPSSIFLTRVDMLRSINDSDNFLSHWRSNKPEMFLSLYNRDGKGVLMARGIGATVATIKDVEDAENEIFSASVSPQSSGRSGLFIRGDYTNGYGYYFLIGGEKKNTWQIMKRNKSGWTPAAEITQGVLANVSFACDKKYWLRAEARGSLMEFYISFDGQTYEKLGEITDNEFRGGGTGIAVVDGTWSLFDDFKFMK
ncbi:MAG: hypothetical protein WC457_04950 [Patescibacteria group bacterium]